MRTRAAIWLLALSAAVLAMLAVGAVALAAPPDPAQRGKPASVGRPAHVTWSPRVMTGTVAAGGTLTATVSFTVTQPVTNPVFTVVPSHRGAVTVNASGVPTTTLQANTPYTLTVVANTAGIRGGSLNGQVTLKEQGSRRTLSNPLGVRVRIARPLP